MVLPRSRLPVKPKIIIISDGISTEGSRRTGLDEPDISRLDEVYFSIQIMRTLRIFMNRL